ncbi:MAG: hypothetical protein IKH92_10010, partial [Clostridiales bacterium]|nr:hypothetical protein [Clostridiales bacterium]
AANAPSSCPSEETQVIALAAHSPSTPIELPAQAPTSAPVEETVPKQTPEPQTEAPDNAAPQEENLDFPDVHGEAEKIDVFGDDA